MRTNYIKISNCWEEAVVRDLWAGAGGDSPAIPGGCLDLLHHSKPGAISSTLPPKVQGLCHKIRAKRLQCLSLSLLSERGALGRNGSTRSRVKYEDGRARGALRTFALLTSMTCGHVIAPPPPPRKAQSEHETRRGEQTGGATARAGVRTGAPVSPPALRGQSSGQTDGQGSGTEGRPEHRWGRGGGEALTRGLCRVACPPAPRAEATGTHPGPLRPRQSGFPRVTLQANRSVTVTSASPRPRPSPAAPQPSLPSVPGAPAAPPAPASQGIR